jgi:hypothetical protein
MNNRIAILGAVLAAQLLLALGLNLAGEDYGAFEPEEKLLTFDAAAVDGLRIEDGKGSVTLKKSADRWVLPTLDAYPVGAGKTEALLERLAGLEKGWPVATSAGAAERFKLTGEQFERRITLLVGDAPRAVLYVGSSPGFRRVHVRPDGDDAVYAVEFSTWEAGAAAADWVDKTVLELRQDEITGVRMPGFELRRDGEVMQLVGLGEQETIKQEKVDGLLRQLAGLRIQSVLGRQAKAEYGQDQPVLTLSVSRRDGGDLEYRFSKPAHGDDYVLKRSDQDYFFALSQFSVDDLQQTTRESLLEARGSAQAPGDGEGAPPAD